MTILAELAALYDRSDDMPLPGYSTEKIGGEVVLAPDGTVVEINRLGFADEKGKWSPRSMQVPSPPGDRRGKKVVAGKFWDPAPYAIGISFAGDQISTTGDREDIKLAAFRESHLTLIEGLKTPSFNAFRKFLESWDPTTFPHDRLDQEILATNLVFKLQGESIFLHELPEVRALLQSDETGGPMCLVTGNTAPVARLHPSIKGVMGAQSAGASLVSFNELAYESHGKKQGDNAPVSQDAAFAYGTALNAMLARGSGQNLRVGDTTVVFWVNAANKAQADYATQLFGNALNPPPEDENMATRKLADELDAVAKGRWQAVPDYDPDTRVFVLGLAPNAARLAVRFWHRGRMQDFAARLATFWEELQITPSPWIGRDGVERPPSAWRLLYDIAALGKAENIPPLLGGALMRAILTGTDYPRMLLSGVIGRLRVEGTPGDRNADGRRAAIIRAVLTRDKKQKEVPMALDETSQDTAYVLGRLFAAFTYAERSYADRGATIRDKYMGGASATPARIFPVLMRGYENNRNALAKAGGNKAGSGVKAEKAVAAILGMLPGGGDLPATLALEDQGRFFVGFYHQLSAFYTKAEDAVASTAPEEETA